MSIYTILIHIQGVLENIFLFNIEMFYLNSTLNFEMRPVLIFQLEVHCKVDKLLTGLSAKKKGTTAQWNSNKTSLVWAPYYLSAYNLPFKNIMMQKNEIKATFLCLVT